MVLDVKPSRYDSEKALRDAQVFLETRADGGSPRWKQAIHDADLSLNNFIPGFNCATQHDLLKQGTPEFYMLYAKVLSSAGPLINKSKKAYKQKRPYILYKGDICMKSGGYDYPSGHAMFGWMAARLLAEIYPERRKEIFAHARSFAESRVICGVHSLSAVEVAEYYSQMIMARLKKSSAFKRDLALVKQQMQAQSESKNFTQPCEQFPARFVQPYTNNPLTPH